MQNFGEINWINDFAISSAIGGFFTAAALWHQHVLSKWRSIIWITLGWAISGLISSQVGYILADTVSNYRIGIALGGGIGGALGGFFTANILRIEHAISGWKSILSIILGCAIGSAIGWSHFPIPWELMIAQGGAICGSVIIIALWLQDSTLNHRSILWIALGWTIGLIIGWVIGFNVGPRTIFGTWWPIQGAISWVVSGAIGAAIGEFASRRIK